MFVKEVLGEWHRGRGGRIWRLTAWASAAAKSAVRCSALLGGRPLPTDLLPFVPSRNRVVYLLRPADLGAHGGNSRRVDWADGRRNNRANARWTNRANLYSVVAKRDYLAVDTPAFTPRVPGGRHHECSEEEDCSRNDHGNSRHG